MALNAESEARRAEAEKIRVEVQVQQNAEAARVLEKREQRVYDRSKDLRSRLSRDVNRYAIGVGLLTFVLLAMALFYAFEDFLLPFRLSTIHDNSNLFWIVAAYVVLVAGAFLCLGWLRSHRKLRELEREAAAYDIRIGDYSGLGPEAAVTYFAERIEQIASGVSSTPASVVSRSTASVTAPTTAPLSPRDSQILAMGQAVQTTGRTGDSQSPQEGPIDVFLAYSPVGIVPAWVAEFKPLFETWLGEAVGRHPIVSTRTSTQRAGRIWPMGLLSPLKRLGPQCLFLRAERSSPDGLKNSSLDR